MKPMVPLRMVTTVRLERIHRDDHWGTDVAVGGLGDLIGRVVSSPSDDVTYTPIVSTDRMGLRIQF